MKESINSECIDLSDHDKQKIDFLAVFDLDGTLYKCNSHIEILNSRYNINIFDSIFMKAFGKLFGRLYLKILFYAYGKIPKEYIRNFEIEFRKSALDLLEKKRKEGYHIIIISNAPKELIEAAASRLNVKWLNAEIGHKDEVLKKIFSYDELLVCTDNVSDMNLLDLANEKYIYITEKTKDLFVRKYPNAFFREE